MNGEFPTPGRRARQASGRRLLTRLITELLKPCCIVGLAAIQCGCYTPNQRVFENLIHDRVSVGMPLSTAVSNLRAIHMQCSGDGPITCDRIRQRLLSSSCIERAVLGSSPAGSLVETLEVRPIICTGL